jgi:hypothetical protein
MSGDGLVTHKGRVRTLILNHRQLYNHVSE